MLRFIRPVCSGDVYASDASGSGTAIAFLLDCELCAAEPKSIK
jgi:hypothetical protein